MLGSLLTVAVPVGLPMRVYSVWAVRTNNAANERVLFSDGDELRHADN